MMDEITFIKENTEIIEHLKSEIFRSFSEAKPPEKNNIALHECAECEGVRNDFAGLKWQDASNSLLEANYDKIPLFSPQSFNYFFPAFLLYTLNNFNDEHSEVCQFTLYAVTSNKGWKNSDGKISDYWVEKFRSFTFAQMNCIYQFLELARQNPFYSYNEISGIEKAFDRLKEIKAASEK